MRDVSVLIGIALVAALVGAGVFFYGKGSGTNSAPLPGTPATTAVPFTELAHGDLSTVTQRTNYLITSQGQMSELWKMLDAGGQTPVVDFATNDVIAIFAGSEPTAGYGIAVSKIADSSVRDVSVTLTKPGGSCVLAQHVTAPYQVIEAAKTTLSLTHEDTVSTISCVD